MRAVVWSISIRWICVAVPCSNYNAKTKSFCSETDAEERFKKNDNTREHKFFFFNTEQVFDQSLHTKPSLLTTNQVRAHPTVGPIKIEHTQQSDQSTPTCRVVSSINRSSSSNIHQFNQRPLTTKPSPMRTYQVKAHPNSSTNHRLRQRRFLCISTNRVTTFRTVRPITAFKKPSLVSTNQVRAHPPNSPTNHRPRQNRLKYQLITRKRTRSFDQSPPATKPSILVVSINQVRTHPTIGPIICLVCREQEPYERVLRKLGRWLRVMELRFGFLYESGRKVRSFLS